VSLCDYAPLEGMELACAIDAVYLRGTLAAENGQVVRENLGQYIKRGLPEYL
jgi:dihydropyrimidinase